MLPNMTGASLKYAWIAVDMYEKVLEKAGRQSEEVQLK